MLLHCLFSKCSIKKHNVVSISIQSIKEIYLQKEVLHCDDVKHETQQQTFYS